MTAVRPALISMVSRSSRLALPRDRSASACPIHVVTPVASRPSLTTKSAAIMTTAGSENPTNA